MYIYIINMFIYIYILYILCFGFNLILLPIDIEDGGTNERDITEKVLLKHVVKFSFMYKVRDHWKLKYKLSPSALSSVPLWLIIYPFDFLSKLIFQLPLVGQYLTLCVYTYNSLYTSPKNAECIQRSAFINGENSVHLKLFTQ